MLLSDAEIASQYTPTYQTRKTEEMKKKKAFSRAAVVFTLWLKIFIQALQKIFDQGLKKTVFRQKESVCLLALFNLLANVSNTQSVGNGFAETVDSRCVLYTANGIVRLS